MARMSNADRQRDYYHMRVEMGRCIKACGRQNALGRVMCDECRATQRVRDAAKYQRAKQRRKERAS